VTQRAHPLRRRVSAGLGAGDPDLLTTTGHGRLVTRTGFALG
jgi:hypothetical protein